MTKYAIIRSYTHGDRFEDVFDEVEKALSSADSTWASFSDSQRKDFDYFGVMANVLDEDGCFDTNTAKGIKRYDVMFDDSIPLDHEFEDFKIICRGFRDGKEGFLIAHDGDLYFAYAETCWADQGLASIDTFIELERKRDTDWLDEDDIIRDEDYKRINLLKIMEEI